MLEESFKENCSSLLILYLSLALSVFLAVIISATKSSQEIIKSFLTSRTLILLMNAWDYMDVSELF